jgi:hypothetical protein
VKENNQLHYDVIQAKESVESTEIRIKSQLRTLQNENQDLRFLIDQKDVRQKKTDKKVSQMKERLDEALSKLYHPGQDEVIHGLASKGEGEHNVLKGAQNIYLANPLGNEGQEVSAQEQVDAERVQDEVNRNNEAWA